MSDPVYQPPKTDPRLQGGKLVKVPQPKIDVRKLLLWTFIPSIILLIGSFLSGFSFEIFLLSAFAAVLLGFIFSIFTSVYLAQARGSLVILAYILLFMIVHTALLYFALVIGCGQSSSNFYS